MAGRRRWGYAISVWLISASLLQSWNVQAASEQAVTERVKETSCSTSNSNTSNREIVTAIVSVKEPSLLEQYPSEKNQSLSEYIAAETGQREGVQRQIAQIKQKICALEDTVEFLDEYDVAFSGFSVKLPRDRVDELRGLDGVQEVAIQQTYTLPEQSEQENDLSEEAATALPVQTSANATGKGTVIAVLDTGIFDAHEAFGETPAKGKYTYDKMQQMLDMAGERLVSVQSAQGALHTADDVFRNAKIPYVYDYANNKSEFDISNPHGTQIADVAAGKNGVAPDAQLFSMKIYDESNQTTDTAILAALQDAITLGADVIDVNVGKSGAFSSEADAMMQEVYDAVRSAGISLEAPAGEGETYRAKAENPDCGSIHTPAANRAALSVAAAHNGSQAQIWETAFWGPTSDLCIKPELTAPGECINGAYGVTDAGSTYAALGGSTVSAAYVAGAQAVLKEYTANQYRNITDRVERANLIDRLLLSTAVPMLQQGSTIGKESVYTSVRRQGAGMVNLSGALQTKAYLTVSGFDRPKAELGERQDGVYSFTMQIVNTTDQALTYELGATVQAESAEYDSKNVAYTTGQEESLLDHGATVTFRADKEKDGRITVAAQSEASVQVQITLDLKREEIRQRQKMFKNGFFINGFIFASSKNGSVDLSLPYLGFCGDWAAAPVLDKSAYGKTKPEFEGNYVYRLNLKKGEKIRYGGNPFAIQIGAKTTYEKERIVLSPNAKQNSTSVLYTNTNALRNISKLRYRVKDAANTTLLSRVYKNIPKTERETDGKVQSLEERMGELERFTLDCRDVNGKILADGTYTLSISAAPAGTSSGSYTKTTSYPITIDGQAPIADPKKNTLLVEQGRLQLQVSVSDGYALAGIQVVDAENRVVLSQVINAGKSFAQKMDLGTVESLTAQGIDVDHLSLIVYDYAMNQTTLSFGDMVKPSENPSKPFDEKTSVVLRSVAPSSDGGMKLSYTKIDGADGYVIYRSTAKKGTYVKVGKTKKLTYTDRKEIRLGKTYYYKVRAYVKQDGKAKYGVYSKVKSRQSQILCATMLIEADYLTPDRIRLIWKQNPDATGYELYCSETKNSGYKRIKRISKGTKTQYEVDVELQKTYYYKIRVLRKAGGILQKSIFSEPYDVTT